MDSDRSDETQAPDRPMTELNSSNVKLGRGLYRPLQSSRLKTLVRSATEWGTEVGLDSEELYSDLWPPRPYVIMLHH